MTGAAPPPVFIPQNGTSSHAKILYIPPPRFQMQRPEAGFSSLSRPFLEALCWV
jgi:hypothetical protein